MTRDEIRNTVYQLITDMQQAAGRAKPALHGGIRPFQDLEGFSSYHALQLSGHLAGWLGCEFTYKEHTELFQCAGQNKTIDEVVDFLWQKSAGNVR